MTVEEQLEKLKLSSEQTIARFSNPWTVEIRNHSNGHWSEFCHDAPLTLADAEERERTLRAHNPDAQFRVIPWLNSSQRALIQKRMDSSEQTIAELREQLAGNENWWDQNSVQCGNCSAELVVRNSSIPRNHNALSHEEGEEESLCGYCAGEELHALIDERDGLRSQLQRERAVSDALAAALKECADQPGCSDRCRLNASAALAQHTALRSK